MVGGNLLQRGLFLVTKTVVELSHFRWEEV
jgi:hypothetical protein